MPCDVRSPTKAESQFQSVTFFHTSFVWIFEKFSELSLYITEDSTLKFIGTFWHKVVLTQKIPFLSCARTQERPRSGHDLVPNIFPRSHFFRNLSFLVPGRSVPNMIFGRARSRNDLERPGTAPFWYKVAPFCGGLIVT